ncbi:MAG: type II CAAX endopeptidase family protein [Nitrososphaerota archaeon]
MGSLFSIPLAYTLWFFTFRVNFSSFWLRLVLSVFVLLSFSLILRRKDIIREFRTSNVELLIGVAVGIGLYLFMLAGYRLLEFLVAHSASEVYKLGMGVEPYSVALLLIFTSIGEESYWRGLILHVLREKMGTMHALALSSLLYSSVHVWTMNIPLMLVAFIAGVVWGLLYMKTGSLASASASHITWTELIFVFAPLR